jgi:hypothetical protein
MSGIGPIVSPLWTPYSHVILTTPNLNAYWPMQEPTGVKGVEVKGNNAGVYVTGTVVGVAGVTGSDADSAVIFNGSSQWMTVPKDASLTPHPLFSLEAWFKGTASSYQSIAGFWDGSGKAGYDLLLGSASRIAGSVEGSSSIAAGANIGAPLNDGLWHHVIMSATGSTLDFYTDGVQPANGHIAGTWTWADPLYTFGIGARSGGGNLPGALTIKRVALYSRNLTLGEAAQHNAAGRA